MLLQIVNEYKRTAVMNILFIKRYRINGISASANESGSFPHPKREKRIIAIMKTFRHYALDNFFWPELLHSSKQNLLHCGKRTKTIQYFLWKHSGEFILLKGFFIKTGSPLIEASMFSVFLYRSFIVEHRLWKWSM